ncbi:MAG: hypothetical protein RR323_06040 [Raoultibacter sp.]
MTFVCNDKGTGFAHKIREVNLGGAFKQETLAKYYRDNTFSKIAEKTFDSFSAEIKEKSKALDRMEAPPEAAAMAAALNTIYREDIHCFDEFSSKATEVLDFSRSGKIELYQANVAIQDMNAYMAHVKECLRTQDDVEGLAEIPKGLRERKAKAAYLSEHAAGIERNAAAVKNLAEAGFTPEDIPTLIADYQAKANAYLDLKNQIDGSASRIMALSDARFVSNIVLSEATRQENWERAQAGLLPKKPPVEMIKHAPAKAEGIPYWKLNIKKDKYREIAKTANTVRRNMNVLGYDIEDMSKIQVMKHSLVRQNREGREEHQPVIKPVEKPRASQVELE